MRRIFAILISVAVAPLAADAQTFDTLHEWGNAADANATSGAGIARGFTSAAGVHTITAGGTDIWGASDHGSGIFDSTTPANTGNFSAVVKVQIGLEGEVMPGEWGRTGIMARTDPAAANSANFASIQKFDGPNQHILQARDSAGADTGRPSNGMTTTLVTGPDAAGAGTSPVPVWLSLHRFDGNLYTTWAPDVGGSPGTWSVAETRAASADHNGPVHIGLVHQNHNVQPETSTATFTDFATTDFNNALGSISTSISRPDQLGLAAGKVTGDMFQTRVLGVASPAGTQQEAVDWKVELLGDPTYEAGLFARSYLRGNSGSQFVANNLTEQGSGQLAQIAWAGNANPPPGGLEKYPDFFNLPADTNTDTDNQENYSVDAQGEIFIPAPGTYRFKDGIDDYTFMQIDGETLIDDNTWTGIDGTANGGSPIVEKTFATAGWKSFHFQMAEGGGGDAGILYWDHDNTDFPAGQTDPAGLGALIPPEFFRTPIYPVLGMVSNDSIQEGVLMGPGGEMLTAEPGQLARITVNGVEQIVEVVPEPSSLLACLLGSMALLGMHRRRRR